MEVMFWVWLGVIVVSAIAEAASAVCYHFGIAYHICQKMG